ncbi:MAG: AsmA family protein [Pseudomonadota bacterium]|nr:AsmA family protein [Pseudomonadota bacterium]
MAMAKRIGIILGGLLALLILVVVLVILLVDPNAYKGRISELVESRSGYQLTLEGDLGWSLFPVLGLDVGAGSLAVDSQTDPFLRWQQAALGVKLLPLFSGELQADEIRIAGLQANLQVDAQGHNNWSPQVAAEPASAGSAAGGDEGAPLEQRLQAVTIPLLMVTESRFSYRDQTAGTDLQLTLDRLRLKDVQWQDPISLDLEAGIQQGPDLTVSVTLESQLSPRLAEQRIVLDAIKLQLKLAGLTPQPVPIELQAGGELNWGQGTARLNLERISLAQLVLSGELTATDLNQSPRLQGQLDSRKVAPRQLLTSLGLEPPPMGDDVLRHLQFKSRLSGTDERLLLNNLQLTLDDSTLTGQLSIGDFAAMALGFDLQLDRINLDAYLPPSPAEEGKDGTSGDAPAGDDQLLPVEALRQLNLAGTLQVGELQYWQQSARDMRIKVNARDGLLRVEPLQAELLDGALNGSLRLDVRGPAPQMTTRLDVEQLELAPVSSRLMEKNLISGRASLLLDSTASGNTTDELLRSALGELQLNVAEGILHGVSLNAIVVDALRDQLRRVEQLVPNYQEYLPRQLQEDTDISRLQARARIENGELIMPDFAFYTGASGIDAQGRVDLLEQAFVFDFGVALSALERNKYLHGARWPVHCAGQLSGAPADWCRPDLSAISSILKQAAGDALKNKSAAELGDKLGLEAEDQQQLRQEVQDKLQAEEERAKRKLREKLNKLLD